MGFRKFTVTVLFLIVIIAICPVFIFWSWHTRYMVVIPVALMMVWLAAIVLLFFQQTKLQRELKRFLMTFRYNDSMVKFNHEEVSGSRKDIYQEFDRILESYTQLKISKERELLFYRFAEENSGIGLLAFSADGNIRMMNKALMTLCKLKKRKNISDFKKENYDLWQVINQAKPGQETLKLSIGNQLQHLAIRTVVFRYEQEEVKLMAFQDIRMAINQSELDAWQKLIRILRHEIHNTLSPITFLSSGLIRQLEDEISQNHKVSEAVANQVLEGLQVIRSRSIGLSEFVENYRQLTNLPVPNIKPVKVDSFFYRLNLLFEDKLCTEGIAWKTGTNASQAMILMDEMLIEQVIINLISNAVEAVKEVSTPAITLNFRMEDDAAIISLQDNGTGIPVVMQEEIFTPFFTTKENGSGIGLSISRQIMQMHQGSLIVESEPLKGTIFSLVF